MMDAQDLFRLERHPGMHGVHCTKCDRLFDAFDTPTRLDEGLMRMKSLTCPSCGKRKHLNLLMPYKYREMASAFVAREAERERIRQIADKYISR